MFISKVFPSLVVLLSIIKRGALQGCNRDITVTAGSPGVIESPGFPNPYPGASDCIYTLTSDRGSAHVSITFDKFSIEQHRDCAFDYLAVYDGPSTASPIIGKRFCGDNLPPKVSGTGQYLTIHFRSDTSVNEGGFSISYRAGCSYEYTESHGVLRSPNYPFIYSPSSECTYNILLDTGSQLLLQFKYFVVEESSDCSFDYLMMSISDKMLKKYCGSIPSFSKLLNTSRLSLTFHSDRSVNRKGFYIEYNVTTDCSVNNGGCDHQCSDLKPGQVLCTCRPGYRLDKTDVRCVDINECVGGASPCSDRCTNLIGSYRCSCDTPGYRLSPDNKTCTDMTCKINNGGCEQICQPFGKAQYHCGCHLGFVISSDAHNCTDIDECSTESDNYLSQCEHKCVNEPGSYYCLCNDGYILSTNQRTCEDVDECSAEGGACAHRCENIPGGWQCACYEGYQTDPVDDTDCVDVDECTQGLVPDSCSPCVNTEGSYICTCVSGYLPNDDNTNCTDINECSVSNGNCGQLCLNTPGSYRCGCRVGYAPDNAEATSCSDINECTPKEGKGPCDQFCTNSVGAFECLCNLGYFLKEDKLSCGDINECGGEDEKDVKDRRCEQECVNTDGGFHCECYAGYQEVNSTCIDIDECLGDPCDSTVNTTCSNSIGSFTCTCPSGYSVANTTGCMDDDECLAPDHGCDQLCVNSPGTYGCECHVGYVGTWNDCTDLNECSRSDTCDQLCVNLIGSYRCECGSGYYLLGDQRNCSDLDECAEQTDDCQQICINEIGYHRCECDPGYILNPDNITCSDINECSGGTSGCSNWCTNIDGSYLCHCDKGYELQNDNHTCQDEDECADDNGGCDHICTNLNGTFRCGCMEGYHFNGTSSCSDIDECATSNGNCSQICNNTEGAYECACEPNFKLGMDNMTCSHCPTCADFEQLEEDVAQLMSLTQTVALLTQNNLQLRADVAALEQRIANLELSSTLPSG